MLVLLISADSTERATSDVSWLVVVGSLLGIAGLLVTLAAFVIGHGRTFRDLEPGLVSRWRRSRASFERIVLRRPPKAHTLRVDSVVQTSSVGTPRLSQWPPKRPSDPSYLQLEALWKYVEQLRVDVLHEHSESDEIRKSVTAIGNRITEIESSRAAEQHKANKASLMADRWEVRGLFFAVVGAAMSLLGSLTGW